jgi:hypothetical protein
METEQLVALHFEVDNGFASVACNGQSVLMSIEQEGKVDGIEWSMRDAERIAAAIHRLVQQYLASSPNTQIGTPPASGGGQRSSSGNAPRILLCASTPEGIGRW